MRARIYQPAKVATQAGKRKENIWIIEFENSNPQKVEPLMGWITQKNAMQQVRLQFSNKKQAIEYANKNKIQFWLDENRKIKKPKKAVYADNFSYKCKNAWTH